MPDHAAIAYNRASTLFEYGDLDGAVDGLLEAMSIGIPEPDLSYYKAARGGLVQMAFPSKHEIRYPDYFLDIETYLHKVEAQRAEGVPLLHGLAPLARIRKDDAAALGYYTRILDLDPEDHTALTNQALLESQEDPT
ncbi:TPA: hypothetical protein DCE37_00915 [Candidatus Latescibacteria bacterium]|nr:hypothetical protein [Candidatus Latescibacterota bacterium]